MTTAHDVCMTQLHDLQVQRDDALMQLSELRQVNSDLLHRVQLSLPAAPLDEDEVEAPALDESKSPLSKNAAKKAKAKLAKKRKAEAEA